jgi:predicted nucleotidyltransferase
MEIIGETNVGSHVWGMNHQNSDIDIFQVYIEPIRSVLDGTAKKKSYFVERGINDIAQHEIEVVINQLLKGNINFIVGVCSPIVNKSTLHFEMLKHITTMNLAKNCYHSINGMAVHNFKKYKDEMTDKKYNQIIRILCFGINILQKKQTIFQAVTDGNEERYLETLQLLKDSYETSTLPEKPDEKIFRSFLLQVRLKQLQGHLSIKLGLIQTDWMDKQ